MISDQEISTPMSGLRLQKPLTKGSNLLSNKDGISPIVTLADLTNVPDKGGYKQPLESN